jgi:uracil-DNA glycosylase
MDKDRELSLIREEVAALTSSPLYAYRKENNYLPVVGEGSVEAEIMFVGEAPGKNEALTGKPFCGRAGKLLDELLASINLPRESVYITSI